MSHKWIYYGDIGDGFAYCAHILVRQNIKGARRQMHVFYADYEEVLWNDAIDFLTKGFSVIRVDLWEVS